MDLLTAQSQEEMLNKLEESEYTEIIDIDDEAKDAQLDKKDLTSFASLYQELLRLEDIIITIPSHELQQLRDGMKDIKYRTNQKMTKAGLDLDLRRIDIQVIDRDSDDENCQVRICFRDKKGISVLSIKPTSDEM